VTPEHLEIRHQPVTVAVVMVNGKQMTKAVYRQIVQETIVDFSSGRQKPGEILGWVNEHTDDCSTYEAHLHLLWVTVECQLRRAKVTERRNDYLEWQRQESQKQMPKPEWAHIQDLIKDGESEHAALWERCLGASQLFIAV
jgi:hypothetical protein